jgi:hypothetical protein
VYKPLFIAGLAIVVLSVGGWFAVQQLPRPYPHMNDVPRLFFELFLLGVLAAGVGWLGGPIATAPRWVRLLVWYFLLSVVIAALIDICIDWSFPNAFVRGGVKRRGYHVYPGMAPAWAWWSHTIAWWNLRIVFGTGALALVAAVWYWRLTSRKLLRAAG